MARLAERLHQRISEAPQRFLSFADVMEMTLYDADGGYYGRGPRRLGRSGDFYTSVSVGPLFGKLLADFARTSFPGTEPGQVIEQAAHDGQLAEDILRCLPTSTKYTVVEPAAAFRSVQEARLAEPFGSQVQWIESLDQLRSGPDRAIFVCNELIDAFPVHVVRWTGGEWLERCVTASEDGSFAWMDVPPTSEPLKAELKSYPRDLPEGFTTEVNLAMLEWIRSLSQAAFIGKVIVADYGLDTEELFDPSRSKGTLRRYRNHQTDDQVLSDLGDCDLTTHIHFTRLIEEAEACGMTVESYQDQGRWLTHIATPWLQSLEGKPPNADTRAALRQFQTLTHPQFMGRSFRVLVLAKPEPQS